MRRRLAITAALLGALLLRPSSGDAARVHLLSTSGSRASANGVLPEGIVDVFWTTGVVAEGSTVARNLVCIVLRLTDGLDRGCAYDPPGLLFIDPALNGALLDVQVPSEVFEGQTLHAAVRLAGDGPHRVGVFIDPITAGSETQIHAGLDLVRDAQVVPGSLVESVIGGGEFQPGSSGLMGTGTQSSARVGDTPEVKLARTTKISNGPAGLDSDGRSERSAISASGRYVAFSSSATNITRIDTNAAQDIFVDDRVTGTTERVSVSSIGSQANGPSALPAISADGRFVAFQSQATNLVSGATPDVWSIYVRDRRAGTTTLVSKSESGGANPTDATTPSISADGSLVAFASAAALTAADTNCTWDVYVRDTAADTVALASVDSAGDPGCNGSFGPAISPDGRYVAFVSDGRLVPEDDEGARDVYRHDRLTGGTIRVSVDDTGDGVAGASFAPAISADGRFVAFTSAARLDPFDTNGVNDIYVRDTLTGDTTRESISSAGAQANGASDKPALTADGGIAVFESLATNLVSGDSNSSFDVFLRDRFHSTTTRLSLANTGAQCNGASFHAAIARDGTALAFVSTGTNLVPRDGNGEWDAFVRAPL